MQELKDILDYINQMDYETLFKNLKGINDKNLQEKLRKEININFKTNADLSYEELRLYGYRKLIKYDAVLGVKKALEKTITSQELVFYTFLNDEKVILNELVFFNSFYVWFLNNKNPKIYFKKNNVTYELIIYDIYFYGISDGKNVIKCEALGVFGKEIKKALSLLSSQIERKLNELCK